MTTHRKHLVKLRCSRVPDLSKKGQQQLQSLLVKLGKQLAR